MIREIFRGNPYAIAALLIGLVLGFAPQCISYIVNIDKCRDSQDKPIECRELIK